jgi:ArsR family transcriptional regulator
MAPNLDVIADSTRRRILALLAVEREVCVCEFVAGLDEVQPAMSRHLGLLRDAGWIVARREGTWIHYRLARLPSWAITVIDALVAGGVSAPALRKARARLAAFPGRPSRTPERIA